MSRMIDSVNTGIYITKEQHEWVQKNSINLSDFVRKKLDEEMEE